MLSSAPNTVIIKALGSVPNVGSSTLRTLEPCGVFCTITTSLLNTSDNTMAEWVEISTSLLV
ncbi:hypothetical protein D9M69_651310 [compost metagenome]